MSGSMPSTGSCFCTTSSMRSQRPNRSGPSLYILGLSRIESQRGTNSMAMPYLDGASHGNLQECANPPPSRQTGGGSEDTLAGLLLRWNRAMAERDPDTQSLRQFTRAVKSSFRGNQGHPVGLTKHSCSVKAAPRTDWLCGETTCERASLQAVRDLRLPSGSSGFSKVLNPASCPGVKAVSP